MINARVLLITPPFTQLNTPYPATAYIKGFLKTIGVKAYQVDLSIEVILAIFNKRTLTEIFDYVEDQDLEMSDKSFAVFIHAKKYLATIDNVMSFLQNKNMTFAQAIIRRDTLPEGQRFDNLTDEAMQSFGKMGFHDLARHIATLYLEDLGDFITEMIDPDFGFSRYAERIGRTATHFDDMDTELLTKDTMISRILVDKVIRYIDQVEPELVCITAPFAGNVYGAFKCAQTIKQRRPNIKTCLGGGYANTELRCVYDERVFDYFDYITLDDGEAPLQHLIEYLDGKRAINDLKRTFTKDKGVVQYINGSKAFDIPQTEVGTPDYSDLWLDKYVSVIETINPMHKLWSDGRWNKLTLAHGCYWGKCTFCDVSLDYIARYEPISATQLVDRIEEIIAQTGENGFHFVDEAAPPAVMRDLALEIIKRNLSVVWWTNIRFEKTFTSDLCRLLRASGCIAVSGGLEVASDRLLDLMKKGVTVAQVAQVSKSFTDANIMVHAYLMYGFPTQTDQETIDSLEMVRQMFALGIVKSGFWHQFAMTAHSPVGLNPEKYHVEMVGPSFGGFAENDYFHNDPTGAQHEKYSEGLSWSLHNYMNGIALDEELDFWFDFDVPLTSVQSDYIANAINSDREKSITKNDKIIWIGGEPTEIIYDKSKKNATIHFSAINGVDQVYVKAASAQWLIDAITEMQDREGAILYQETNVSTIAAEDLGVFRKAGLLFV